MTQVFLNSQIRAVDKLNKVKCGALFMEAGTGKTRATMELVKTTDADYVLWFTPFQTKENLRTEIAKWGGLMCDIVGIESISNSDRIYLEYYNKLVSAKNAFLICDESLKIKNPDAKRTQRLLKMSELAEYRMVLNGTPLSRNLLDLWSQMQFLSPKILKMRLSQFKKAFVEYIEVTYHSSGYGRPYSKEFIKKYHNIDYLYELIEPFIFESKLSLSVGQQHIDLAYSLTDEEKKEHDELKKKYLNDEYLIARKNNIFLEITQKMQHNYSLSPEKFNIVDSLLKNEDKSKFLIYAKYVDTQEKLRNHYNEVQVMSMQKHSYGFNLQDYNKIIFWDKTWDYAHRDQTERRIYREGQKNDCTYYDLTGDVGLEKMINQNIEKKRSLLDIFSKKTTEQLKAEL